MKALIPFLCCLIFCYSIPLRGETLPSPLTSSQEHRLLRYARLVLERTVSKPRSELLKNEMIRVNHGVFVTLMKNNRVRGCYGSLFPQAQDLYSQIEEFVTAAATADFRHAPVRASELNDIVIIITFIGALESVSSVSEIDPKMEGLLLRSEDRAAVLLPGEAKTASWQIQEAKRQAGISPAKGAELFRIHTATLYER